MATRAKRDTVFLFTEGTPTKLPLPLPLLPRRDCPPLGEMKEHPRHCWQHRGDPKLQQPQQQPFACIWREEGGDRAIEEEDERIARGPPSEVGDGDTEGDVRVDIEGGVATDSG